MTILEGHEIAPCFGKRYSGNLMVIRSGFAYAEYSFQTVFKDLVDVW
jgi:hypothetical protein